MSSIEQCIELSAAEYQELFGILFHKHKDNIKDSVICAAIDVASTLLKLKNREDIYSTNTHDLQLEGCNINL